MVVEPRKKDAEQAQPSKKALMISIGAHLVVFFLIIFGLPHFKDDPIIADPVPVELIANVGELTTTNKPKVEAPKPEKPKEEPPKKTEEEKKPEPKKTTPPPPDEETLKDPPKPKDKEAEKKPEPKKEKPKEEKPKEEKSDFDSLLKDLTPEEKEKPKVEEEGANDNNPEPTPNVSRFSNVLSISEMDALRQQLSQCWSIMSGAANAEDQVVEVSVVVNMDRTVASAKIVDQSKYNSNPFFRAAADSAMRALRNPGCNPLNVPPEKYDSWNRMTIVFDPKEMF